MAWNEAAPWVAAKRAGMLVKAFAGISACPQQTAGWVDFREPSVELGVAYAQGSETQMRYRVDEFPGLAEGDEIVIEHTKDDVDSRVLYRVQSPDEAAEWDRVREDRHAHRRSCRSRTGGGGLIGNR